MNQFKKYAQHYDLLYRDKNYQNEAEYIQELIKEYVDKPLDSIELLDLACGTGRHIQEFSRLGLSVDGSDLSADMVSVAKKNAEKNIIKSSFYNESFQTSGRIKKKYEVVLAMFSAINYLIDYDDFSLALSNIKSLLKHDGIFIFDFWNGNAVLNSYSPAREKRVQGDNRSIVRTSNTTLDRVEQIATINFDFELFESNQAISKFSEVHKIRYFFPREMEDLLRANKFEVIWRCPFLEANREIDPNDWNLTYIVKPFF